MTGHNTGCAIPTDGTLWCWGRGDHGQLGDGHTAIVRSPEQIGTATNWSALSGSNGADDYSYDAHTCGPHSDGTAWCWGENALGQVGNGTQKDQLTPTQVGSSTAWTSVSAGNHVSCGTRTSGTLWCWGSGDLGNGANEMQLRPVRIGGGSNWVQVSAGGDHTCGTRSDGSLWCWGANFTGAVGDGTTTERLSPVRVGASTTWTSVSAGYGITCGARLDGSAWCWGSNDSGELGNGTRHDSLVPARVAGGAVQWSSDVVLRFRHACGVGVDHRLWCWGYNKYGQVGAPVGRFTVLPAQVKLP